MATLFPRAIEVGEIRTVTGELATLMEHYRDKSFSHAARSTLSALPAAISDETSETLVVNNGNYPAFPQAPATDEMAEAIRLLSGDGNLFENSVPTWQTILPEDPVFWQLSNAEAAADVSPILSGYRPTEKKTA